MREAYYMYYTGGMGSNMGQGPVYRTRNHAYSCRCGRCPQSRPDGDWGIITPVVLAVFAVALIGFWPAMIWHGYTDTGGWRWDIHSTVAEAVYLGTAGFTALMCWLGHRPPKRPVLPPQPDRWWEDPAYQRAKTGLPSAAELPPPPPSVCVPACEHLRAVKVNSALDPALIYHCWCPDCEATLPAKFRRGCCGTEPETPHYRNCPHWKGWPR